MDIILNSRLGQLRDEGVQIQIIRASVPAKLAMEDSDLTALLLNALDNAAAAVTNPDVADPWIQVELHTKGANLYFSCENSTATVKKETAPRRGYGLSIMRRLVDKYSGLLEITPLPGQFRLEIALPVCPTDVNISETAGVSHQSGVC